MSFTEIGCVTSRERQRDGRGSLCFCGTGWEGAAASVPGSALPQYGLGARRRRLLHAAAPAFCRTRIVVEATPEGYFFFFFPFFHPSCFLSFLFWFRSADLSGRTDERATREQRSAAAAAAAAGLGRAAGNSPSGSGEFGTGTLLRVFRRLRSHTLRSWNAAASDGKVR